MLSQVLKLNAILSQCQVKNEWSPSATTYKCRIQVVGDSLELFDSLQIIWVEACYWMIMS
jgi:hypothetical protein